MMAKPAHMYRLIYKENKPTSTNMNVQHEMYTHDSTFDKHS